MPRARLLVPGEVVMERFQLFTHRPRLRHRYIVIRVAVQEVVRAATWLWRGIDVGVIDALANGIASAARALGDSWRRWATGNVQEYALTLLIGVVALLVYVAIGIAG